MTEFANVYHRKLKIDWPQVERIVEQLSVEFSIHTNSAATITRATRLAPRYGFSWFDSLIVAAALERGCQTLYSEDLQDGQLLESSLRVVNPFGLKDDTPLPLFQPIVNQLIIQKMSKELMQEALAAMPTEFDFEEFLERLALLEKIAHSQKQVRQGETLTFDEMKQLAQSWQK